MISVDSLKFKVYSWQRCLALLAFFTLQSSHFVSRVQAQTETAAFYIYQNDGHFDGFFYDDVQKISYSVMDTLGIEHDEIVSQEIVTADSVYRIMLSAIDSIGFVQPEVKYNSRLRRVETDGLFAHLVTHDEAYDNLVFDSSTPAALLPKVGDVFASFDIDNGWSGKVSDVKKNSDGSISVTCGPIDDITDIFEQLVLVEQYDGNRSGELVRRRVAGHPELTKGTAPKRSEGTWEGDLFNFSVSGHIPLYASDDLNITLDPSLDGKVNVKTAWNISLLGEKYIGITAYLDFGVGLGFTVDGQITDLFPSGVGGVLGGVPVPATCPLIYIDVTPDAFIRGDAHVKFSVQSPKLKGGMWAKLEVKNWWPSMDIGFGAPGGNADFEHTEGDLGMSLELNGYVQGGLYFPMTFKSLPVLKKFFAADIGGTWYVGPKLAGAIALDLTTMPWEDDATYKLLKNTKLSLHMLDADFEVKAKVETLFSGKKEVTLLDGGVNVFPPLDAAVVPEFGEAAESIEELYFSKKDQESWKTRPDALDGTKQGCRVFSFEPSGAVMLPVPTGTYLYKKNEQGEYDLVETQRVKQSYYHIHQLMGQEVPKDLYPKFVLWDDKTLSPYPDGEYKVCPMVTVLGKDFVASPAKEFRIGSEEGGKVVMSPNFVHVNFRAGGYVISWSSDEPEWIGMEDAEDNGIYYADWYDDIDLALASEYNTLKPNEAGLISSNNNGFTVTGTFDKTTNEGSGTFTLSSQCFSEFLTMDQVCDIFTNNSSYVKWLLANDGQQNVLMSGSMSHEMEGTFTVRKSGSNYYYTFTGNGTYSLDATAFNEVRNMKILNQDRYFSDPIEVSTTNIKQNGNAKMDYVIKVKE